jgi:hypothetical protein
VYLLTEAMILHDHMFRLGLPVRGAITVGTYYLKDACFAGKCIAEAHDEANDMQLSAIVIADRAFSAFLGAARMGEDKMLYEWLGRIVRPYRTPCRSGFRDKRLLLVATDLLGKWPEDDGRPMAAILRAFSKHNKHLDVGAEKKARNTFDYLRALQHGE